MDAPVRVTRLPEEVGCVWRVDAMCLKVLLLVVVRQQAFDAVAQCADVRGKWPAAQLLQMWSCLRAHFSVDQIAGVEGSRPCP